MNSVQYEIQILNELKSIHDKPEHTEKKYKRVALCLAVLGFAASIVIQFLLKKYPENITVSLILLMACGFCIGLGFFYSQAAAQIRYHVKYTKADLHSINDRLNKLKNT